MASEDKSSFAPVTSKLLLLNFSGQIKTNGVGAREQICLIRISTIRPSPAPGRLALMLFANLFGLCRLFRFIVYKLQTDCFKKLASFNQISQAPSAADEGVLDGGNILCRYNAEIPNPRPMTSLSRVSRQTLNIQCLV